MPHCGGIPVCTPWKPTGRVRLRVGWFGRVIAEVEDHSEHGTQLAPDHYRKRRDAYRWRRARSADVTRDVSPLPDPN